MPSDAQTAPRWTKGRVIGLAMACPALALFAVFAVWPTIRVFWLSFFDWNLVAEPSFVGFDNYRYLLTNDRFHSIVGNTVFYLVGTYAPTIVLALLLAIALDRRLPAGGFLRLLYFAPVAMSWVVASIIWRLVYHPDGLLNQVLSLDLIWLTNSDLAPWALVIMSVWKELGFFLIILIAGLQGLDSDVYEAASIDGATQVQQLRHITIPLLYPILAVCFLLAIYRGGQAFAPQYVMTGGGPGSATEVVNLFVYQTAFVSGRMGRASAVAVLLFLALLAVALVQFRVFRSRT